MAGKGQCPRRLPSRYHQRSGLQVLVGYDPLVHPNRHQGYTGPDKLVLGSGEVTGVME